MLCLGIDTSNYTTSVAIFDGESIVQKKRLLPVKQGERGLRQSDAVFHHTKALPELIEALFLCGDFSGNVTSVGFSFAPTTEKGSYMPCFLAGENAARSVAAATGVPIHSFSHQQGHIAAALYSADRLSLLNEQFVAFHVSGGTTDAVLCEPSKGDIFTVSNLFSSNDLKAGQAIDRIGVKMGFSFPCGKELEREALLSKKVYKSKIKLYNGDCSLSGLENKALKMLSMGESNCDVSKYILTYIADTLSAMTENILNEYGSIPLVFAGGVMSNSIIKEILTSRFECFFAKPEFSCDNAAGIAVLTALKEQQ